MFCAPETTAVEMPTTSPRRLRSGPPEFPGLIAASVWSTPRIVSENEAPSPAVMVRARPETTPTETVLRNSPRALPIAIAVWPSRKESESPKETVGRFAPSILMSAMSCTGSRARTFAEYFLPSFVKTVYSAFGSSTTCLFVTMSPSAETMKPLPPPTSWSRVPFSHGLENERPPPKNSRNSGGRSPKGSKGHCSIMGTFFEMTIETTAGEALSTAFTTRSS